eukprot:19332-Heterococcus_DN1.PRE.6
MQTQSTQEHALMLCIKANAQPQSSGHTVLCVCNLQAQVSNLTMCADAKYPRACSDVMHQSRCSATTK